MCGIAGIIGTGDCAREVAVALQALQHRGQDSSGIGSVCGEEFPLIHKLGLVGQSYGADDMLRLPGPLALGHVRYPTVGRGLLRDAQPFFHRQPGLLMAHNGNFINVREMQEVLREDSIHLLSQCDVEPAMCLFALEMMRRRRRDHTLEDALAALEATFSRAAGAFSILVALKLDGVPTLMAVRDPNGIRPLVWGQGNGSFTVASESVALDAVGARLEGDVAPGEAMFFRRDQAPIRRLWRKGEPAPCIFEFIYFARPDSTMNGRSVYGMRQDLGRELARAWARKGLAADLVVPIPDTARPSAAAAAEELRIPFREGFIKNRYSGRTFIMASPGERQDALRLKLNPIASEFRDRRVLVVDDSIVRGTTLSRTIHLIREQGPREVHLAIYSPPVLYPCYYGIDMSTREELAAPRFVESCAGGLLSAEEQRRLEHNLAARLGLDSLTYLPGEALRRVHPGGCCAACFEGRYPLPVSDERRRWIEEDRRCAVQRELLF